MLQLVTEKLLLKESTIAELLASASTFLKKFVNSRFIFFVQAKSKVVH